MRAGPLRHRVTIQRPIDELAGDGSTTVRYEDWLQRIAAHVMPAGEGASGRESFVSAQIQAVTDTKVRIRYRAGITAKMRVRWEHGQGSPTRVEYFDIEAALPADSQRFELWLMCRSRDAQGFRSGEP